MRTIIKYLVRIIALPFVAGIIIIAYAAEAIKRILMFLMHGGEFNSYCKNDWATIQDIYMELKKEREQLLTK